MAEAYVNPFGMMPNPGDFNSTNLLSVANAQERMNLSQPMIQMARERMGLDNASEQARLMEQYSPLMAGQRAAEARNKTGLANAEIEKRPGETELSIAKTKADLESLPYLTNEIKEKAKEAARKYANTPMHELFDTVGGIYDSIKDAPEQMKPTLYAQALQRWEMQNPGRKIPDQLQQYNENNLAAIRYASVVTAEQAGKERIKGMDVKSNEDTANIRANAGIQEAQIGANARVSAAGITSRNAAEKPLTGPQTIAKLRADIIKDPSNEQAKGEYQLALEEQFTKASSQNPLLQTLAIKAASGDTKALEAYEAAYDKEHQKFMERNKVAGASDKTARVKVKDKDGNIGTIPTSKLNSALKSGYTKVE